MKKFFTILSATLLLAGCARELGGLNAEQGGEAAVTFSVCPSISAKAVADNDGFGACIDSCIVEIYINDHGTFKYYKTPVLETEAVGTGATWKFTESFLKNQNYKIIVWAMNSGEYYIYTPEQATVIKDLTKKVNNLDSLDAFYAVYPFQATAENLSTSHTIIAKRPFAQLNIITTDVDDRYQPTAVSVSYVAPTGIDILNDEVLTDEDAVQCVDVEPYYASTVTGTTRTLSMDYIFAPDDTTLTNIDFDVTMTEKIVYDFDNIPIKRNFRTNIIGNLLTADAQFIVKIDPVWDGEIDYEYWQGQITPMTPTGDGIYYVTKPSELAWVAQQVNSGANNFAGKTVKLSNDISLNNSPWTPIGNVTAYPGITFQGTFDGQGYTISDLKCKDETPNYATAGLFGSLKGVVENVTVRNFDIMSSHYAGVICGYTSSNDFATTIRNCKVVDGTVASEPEFIGGAYDNGDKVGGIIGYCVTGDQILNNEVDSVTVIAHRDLGGIAGAASATVTGNSVKNSRICQSNQHGYKTDVDTFHEIIGRDLGATASDNNFDNVVLKSFGSSMEIMLDEAKEGDTIIAVSGSYGAVTVPANLPANVTLEAEEGVVVDDITIPNGADITNFTIKGFTVNRSSSVALQSGAVGVLAEAKVDNLVIEDCTFIGPGSKTGGAGLWIQSSTDSFNKTVTVKNCTFSGLRYGFYTASAITGTVLKFEGCTFTNMFSWDILVNNASVGCIDIRNCNFDGGDIDGDVEGTNMVKTGGITADNNPDFVFVFKDNVVTKAYGRFVGIAAKASNTTISGNTKNGVAWTPAITVLPE